MVSYTWTNLCRDYWQLLDGRRLYFVSMSLLRMIAQLIVFAVAYLFGELVDTLHAGSIETGYWLIGGIGLLSVIQVLLRFYSKVRIQTVGAELRKETRLSATRQLLEDGGDEHEHSGGSIQNINTGTENIYAGSRVLSNEGIGIMTNLVGSLGLFLVLDARYVVYAGLFTLLYLAAENAFNRRLSYWEDQVNRVKELLTGRLTESGVNASVIRTLGAQDVMRQKSEDHEQAYFDMWFKKRQVSQAKAQTIKVFAGVGYTAFLALLVFDVSRSIITVGAVVTYAKYFDSLRSALDKLTNGASEFIGIKAAIGRFMLRYDIREARSSRLPSPPSDWEHISITDVWYSYGGRTVFQGLSLGIRRGEAVAIQGPSGSGKSTFARLLVGEITPSAGGLYLDDTPLHRYDVHRLLTVIPQEPSMFVGTVRENITLGAAEDERRLSTVLDAACLRDVLSRLPEGIDTQVGEGGHRLSGGERQLVAIARALYSGTPVLVLDEATASMDAATEEAVLFSLSEMQDLTLLIVAHHERTLSWAERRVRLTRAADAEGSTGGSE